MGIEGTLFSFGMLLTLTGFALTFLGTVWGERGRNTNKEETKKIGGLVMIGPIPIVFGSNNKKSEKLVKIATALFILLFVITLISPLFG